jgi:hypothetical protein
MEQILLECVLCAGSGVLLSDACPLCDGAGGFKEAATTQHDTDDERASPQALVAHEGSCHTRKAEAAFQHENRTQTLPTRLVASFNEGVQQWPANVQVFNGEWDAEGVFVYQAFCDEIADWALTNQRFGGPCFQMTRMTWIKPSFGWVLYRSGYANKAGQKRVLKIKLPHDAMGNLLSQCKWVDTNKATRLEHTGSGSGNVQWDPERDMMSANGREPREMLRRRAIQIGLGPRLLELYVRSTLSIQDVSGLAHRVCDAHRGKKKNAMASLLPDLPHERPYMPHCSERCLVELGMLPGQTASLLAQLGRGKAR